MTVQYHYQGRILEAAEEAVSPAGHCMKVQVDKGYHYVWPEQFIKDGVPVKDPYGMLDTGSTLHPERFLSTARPARERSVQAAAVTVKTGPVGGAITLAEVCKELSVEGSLARRILRKHWSRQGGSWTFTPEQADEVKVILVREIKG